MEPVYQIPAKFCSEKEREKFWLKVISDQKTSGSSIKKFCNQHQIKPSTFQYWKYKKPGRQKSTSVDFIPLQVSGELIDRNSKRDVTNIQNKQIEILFKNGHKISLLASGIDLSSLIKTVGGIRC